MTHRPIVVVECAVARIVARHAPRRIHKRCTARYYAVLAKQVALDDISRAGGPPRGRRRMAPAAGGTVAFDKHGLSARLRRRTAGAPDMSNAPPPSRSRDPHLRQFAGFGARAPSATAARVG
jgi:hypothetical protein